MTPSENPPTDATPEANANTNTTATVSPVAVVVVPAKVDLVAQTQALTRWRTTCATMASVCFILAMVAGLALTVTVAMRIFSPEIPLDRLFFLRVNATTYASAGAIWGLTGALLWNRQRSGVWLGSAAAVLCVAACVAGVVLAQRWWKIPLPNSLPIALGLGLVAMASGLGMAFAFQALSALRAAGVPPHAKPDGHGGWKV